MTVYFKGSTDGLQGDVIRRGPRRGAYWYPIPLPATSENVDNDLAGSEAITMAELDAEFDKLAKTRRSEGMTDVDGQEVLEAVISPSLSELKRGSYLQLP